MVTKQKKNSFFLYFIIFIVIFTIPLGFGLSQLAPFDVETGEVYIRGNDVIKNFKLESFDHQAIGASGSPVINGIENKRLKFEKGEFWTASKDDILIQDLQLVDDDLYLYYTVEFKNKVNILTNVRLDQASPSITEVVEYIPVAKYAHQGLYGDVIYGPYYNYAQWKHYYFGRPVDTLPHGEPDPRPLIEENVYAYNDLYNYNILHNTFSGPLTVSFDIAQNPIPSLISFKNGNLTKEFDYIGVNAAYVSNSTHGSLSNDMPKIEGLTPMEYKDEENEVYSEEWAQYTKGVTFEWDPNIQFEDGVIKSTAVDTGVLPKSRGSSLNPVQKNGLPVWDAKQESSVQDCKLTYNINRISPIVYEFSKQLSYTYQDRTTRDWLQSIIPWVIVVKQAASEDYHYTYTRSVGLHVINRYIQFEIGIRFSIWSKFKLNIISDDIELGIPEEFYDDLSWSTIVDGFGGGQTYRSGFEFNIFGNLGLYLGIIFGLIALYLIYKIIKNRKAGRPIFYNINPIKKKSN